MKFSKQASNCQAKTPCLQALETPLGDLKMANQVKLNINHLSSPQKLGRTMDRYRSMYILYSKIYTCIYYVYLCIFLYNVWKCIGCRMVYVVRVACLRCDHAYLLRRDLDLDLDLQKTNFNQVCTFWFHLASCCPMK